VMPGLDGMQVLKEVRKIDAILPVILVTAYASVDSAIEAVKNGAYDYVTKPFKNDNLVLAVRRALESRRLLQENQALRAQMEKGLSLRELRGSGEAISKVFVEVQRVAPTNFTVILTGETGSGKELVARGIHQQSHRDSGPFIPVDCSAIQPNLIESELFGY